mgnify:CR=1 FL=1
MVLHEQLGRIYVLLLVSMLLVVGLSGCQGELTVPGSDSSDGGDESRRMGDALSDIGGADTGGFDVDEGADGSAGDTATPLDTGGRDSGMVRDGGGMGDAGDPSDTGDTGDTGMDADTGSDDCPYVRVTTGSGVPLNVRPDPSTNNPPVGSLPSGYVVEVVSEVRGMPISGNDLWYQIKSSMGNGYISAVYAACTTKEPPEDNGKYYVPFACGKQVPVTQAPGGSFSHTGKLNDAYDFGVPTGTPIHAMRAGVVTAKRLATQPGDPCYNGGGSSCGGESNWVIVQHADMTTAIYRHINTSSASVGQMVAQGGVVAKSGNTGHSTGPHLHVGVRSGCATNSYCKTIMYSFADVGMPTAGTTVTSGNCP